MCKVIEAAKIATQLTSSADTFRINIWIESSTKLSSELKLDKSEMCEQGGVQELGDIHYFMDELENEVWKEFHNRLYFRSGKL